MERHLIFANRCQMFLIPIFPSATQMKKREERSHCLWMHYMYRIQDLGNIHTHPPTSIHEHIRTYLNTEIKNRNQNSDLIILQNTCKNINVTTQRQVPFNTQRATTDAKNFFLTIPESLGPWQTERERQGSHRTVVGGKNKD